MKNCNRERLSDSLKKITLQGTEKAGIRIWEFLAHISMFNLTASLPLLWQKHSLDVASSMVPHVPFSTNRETSSGGEEKQMHTHKRLDAQLEHYSTLFQPY